MIPLRSRFSVFLIEHALVSVRPQQQARHPIRSLSHDIADLLHIFLLRNFDDEFVMDVPDDEAVAKVLHCKTEDIPGYTLDNILDEFRAVTFDP